MTGFFNSKLNLDWRLLLARGTCNLFTTRSVFESLNFPSKFLGLWDEKVAGGEGAKVRTFRVGYNPLILTIDPNFLSGTSKY